MSTVVGAASLCAHSTAYLYLYGLNYLYMAYVIYIWLIYGFQDAIASCPVDCIHWVEKDQLPSLEYVMRNKVKVTDVGTMMGGAGHVADVFAAATQFLKKRDKE